MYEMKADNVESAGEELKVKSLIRYRLGVLGFRGAGCVRFWCVGGLWRLFFCVLQLGYCRE